MRHNVPLGIRLILFREPFDELIFFPLDRRCYSRYIISMPKCLRRSFSDENGTVHFTACGLRSCPLCSNLYAQNVTQAVKLNHPDIVTHFVFTTDDQHIGFFPKEKEYAELKKITKRRCQMRFKKADVADIAFIRDSKYVETVRDLISICSKETNKSINQLLRIIASELDIQIQDIGWIRSVEYGEKNHRWHMHLGIFREPLVVLTALINAGYEPIHDTDRDVYYLTTHSGIPECVVNKVNNVNILDFWRFGMIRITGLSKTKSVINYISSYALKASPGRVTFDKKTSESRRILKSILKPVWRQRAGISQDATFTYAPAGSNHASQEGVKRERAQTKKDKKQNAYL